MKLLFLSLVATLLTSATHGEESLKFENIKVGSTLEVLEPVILCPVEDLTVRNLSLEKRGIGYLEDRSCFGLEPPVRVKVLATYQTADSTPVPYGQLYENIVVVDSKIGDVKFSSPMMLMNFGGDFTNNIDGSQEKRKGPRTKPVE